MKPYEIHSVENLRLIAKEADWMSVHVTDKTTAKAYKQFAESAAVLMVQISKPQKLDNIPDAV